MFRISFGIELESPLACALFRLSVFPVIMKKKQEP